MPQLSTSSGPVKRRRLTDEEMEQLLLAEAPGEEEGIVFEPIEAIPLVGGAAVELRYYCRGYWLLYRYDVGRREIYHADYRQPAPPSQRRMRVPRRPALRFMPIRRKANV